MTKHNVENERIKRQYFACLKEAMRHGNIHSGKRIGQLLTSLADLLHADPRRSEIDLFGDTQKRTRKERLDEQFGKRERPGHQQEGPGTAGDTGGAVAAQSGDGRQEAKPGRAGDTGRPREAQQGKEEVRPDEDGEFANAVLRELGYDGIMAENSNNVDGLEAVIFDESQAWAVSSADGGLAEQSRAASDSVLLSEKRGPYYDYEQEILESRLEQWAAAVKADFRGGARAVREELRQAAEAGADDGSGARALAGSSKETIQRESDELIARAREGGFFLAPDDIATLSEGSTPIKGGIEHDVFLVGETGNRLVIRNTKDGRYGHLSGASPVQYLRRLARNNAVFPATPIQVIGVSEGKDGEAVIWTVQPFVEGETYDSERKFSAAMNDHGWEQARLVINSST